VVPVTPGIYKSGYYVTLGPYNDPVVGESWYRHPLTQEISHAWTWSAMTSPQVLCRAGSSRTGCLSLYPRSTKTSVGEKRVLRAVALIVDGEICKEIDVSAKSHWSSQEPDTAFVVPRDGTLHPKRAGRTSIQCEYDGMCASADVEIGQFSKGTRAIFFQGLRTVTQLRFGSNDNLLLCNQSESVYEIDRLGRFRVVLRLPRLAPVSHGIDFIAVDSQRNLYVSSANERACLMFRPNSDGYTGSGTPLADACPGTKRGIVVDRAGVAYVAVMTGRGYGHVVRITGRSESSFKTRDEAIILAIDPEGNICLPSRQYRSIDIYSPAGDLIRSVALGIADPASDILVDSAGTAYLTMFGSGQVISIDLACANSAPVVIASGFNNPDGIAMDSQGRLYVSNFSGNTIEMIYR